MERSALEPRDGGLLIRIKVQPKSSRNAVIGEKDGRIRIALTAPPVEGAANEALLKFIANVLAIKRHQITFKAGEHARDKTLWVSGITLTDAAAALKCGVA